MKSGTIRGAPFDVESVIAGMQIIKMQTVQAFNTIQTLAGADKFR